MEYKFVNQPEKNMKAPWLSIDHPAKTQPAHAQADLSLLWVQMSDRTLNLILLISDSLA